MTSQVAWLSFDAEQERRTQLVLAALAEQGTIDELGLGVVRDLIAGVLHPGLTVLHTRARYLLFVPRAYRDLSGATADAVIAAGRKREHALIAQLVSHYHTSTDDDRGIIGRRAGERTRQLASGIYWGLLHRLDILRFPGTVADYARQVADVSGQRGARVLLRGNDDVEESFDDVWRELPEVDPDAATSFDLTSAEAQWLRERFVLAEAGVPEQSRSLLAWLLDPARTTWVSGLRSAWDHPETGLFPVRTAEAMWLGRDVDRLVDGARIVYNLLCARRRPAGELQDELVAGYEELLVAWYDELAARGLPDGEFLGHLDEWVSDQLARRAVSPSTHIRWQSTRRFLQVWQERAATVSDVGTDLSVEYLIVGREAALKPGRSRLGDPALLTDWQGDSGIGRFDYNWRVANRLLGDIHRGLGTPVVEA